MRETSKRLLLNSNANHMVMSSEPSLDVTAHYTAPSIAALEGIVSKRDRLSDFPLSSPLQTTSDTPNPRDALVAQTSCSLAAGVKVD